MNFRSLSANQPINELEEEAPPSRTAIAEEDETRVEDIRLESGSPILRLSSYSWRLPLQLLRSGGVVELARMGSQPLLPDERSRSRNLFRGLNDLFVGLTLPELVPT